MNNLFFFFFFFSSRRRHTSSLCDWSSDVCSSDLPWRTVVGVVGGVKQYALDTDSRVTIYMPHGQNASGTMYLVARTSGDPGALAQALTREARAVEPNGPV